MGFTLPGFLNGMDVHINDDACRTKKPFLKRIFRKEKYYHKAIIFQGRMFLSSKMFEVVKN